MLMVDLLGERGTRAVIRFEESIRFPGGSDSRLPLAGGRLSRIPGDPGLNVRPDRVDPPARFGPCKRANSCGSLT
jgi:hypothetical protein